MKTIGILGGMGPGASSVLYQKIIKYSQDQYQAVQDTDYPPIILYSLPLAGFDETGIADPILVKKQLIHGVKILERAGVDFIVIACNTVHLFIAEMNENVSIPIYSIVELALVAAQQAGYGKVGLLSSETTRNLNVYKKIFEKNTIDLLHVTDIEQTVLNGIIEAVMGGINSQKDKRELNKIIKSLAKNGAGAVALGCTELPLAISQVDCQIPLIDTLQLLAEFSVDLAREIEKQKTC